MENIDFDALYHTVEDDLSDCDMDLGSDAPYSVVMIRSGLMVFV